MANRTTSGARARAIDTASIVFGLVAIPVRVFSSAEPSHEVHFHLVHAGCGRRVKQEYRCPLHGPVSRDELAKGYEPSRGTTIELAQSELDALDAVANDEIALAEFVPAAAVDPIYIERTYYLAPGKGGERAYRLLHDALLAAKLVGIADYAARGNAYVVMVRPYQTGLAMHQLRYADEVKPWDAIDLPDLPKPKAAELELARTLVHQLQHPTFDPTAYRDEVKVRVQKLLAEKARSGEVIVAPEAPRAHAIPDLMAALKASLAGSTGNGHRPRTSHAGRSRPAPRPPRKRQVHRVRTRDARDRSGE